SIFVKYDGKFASRWRAKSPDALCAVLPYDRRFLWICQVGVLDFLQKNPLTTARQYGMINTL
ncbi:hypothetical protein, partial [Ruminococcus callidus]|uniref:hypothetical protein n=1 Tax=Ruminococcus callidus TaxID=40519 RepID=UPI0039A107D5